MIARTASDNVRKAINSGKKAAVLLGGAPDNQNTLPRLHQPLRRRVVRRANDSADSATTSICSFFI
jgi:hypothetical protein